MPIGLIPYTPGICGDFAEFCPGGKRGPSWSENSVYMDGDVFFALDLLVEKFDPTAPITFSGLQLDQLISDLEGAARRISNAESPAEIWPDHQRFRFLEPDTSDHWREARREFSLMLRELCIWLRGVKARHEPVTVHAV